MAYIVKKKIRRKGRRYSYYQIVESKWIDGKSIPKVLKHLGTPQRILDVFVEYEKLKREKNDLKEHS